MTYTNEKAPIKIEQTKLVSFSVSNNQLETQPFGTWDDNGGLPDGDMYLLPLSEVTPFEGMTIEDGFIVHQYTEWNNYDNWCGFSSRNVAYTLDRETADAIALDEYGIDA